MINGKGRVLQRLDDRSVGVGQLCVLSNQGYTHMFQKTIRSEKKMMFLKPLSCAYKGIIQSLGSCRCSSGALWYLSAISFHFVSNLLGLISTDMFRRWQK